MNAMTPEQNEQWRAAILPLAERLTGKRWEAEKVLIALLPKEEQYESLSRLHRIQELTDWGAPFELGLLHDALLYRRDQFTKPWFPQFALRSACALHGIQLVPSESGTYYALLNKVYIRFLRESLQPFVEWLGQMPPANTRKDRYTSLVALYEACDELHDSADPEPWRKANSILNMCTEVETESEKGQCLDLVKFLLNYIVHTFHLTHIIVVSIDRPRPLASEIFLLNRQHQWRLMSYSRSEFSDEEDYTHLIADAFLTALEAECPPPDWLPRI